MIKKIVFQLQERVIIFSIDFSPIIIRLFRMSGLFERGLSKNCLLSGDRTDSLPSCCGKRIGSIPLLYGLYASIS